MEIVNCINITKAFATGREDLYEIDVLAMDFTKKDLNAILKVASDKKGNGTPHFVIERDGTVSQLVELEDRAKFILTQNGHAVVCPSFSEQLIVKTRKDTSFNHYSVAVTFSGVESDLTAEQYQSMVDLIKYLDEHGCLFEHIMSARQVVPKYFEAKKIDYARDMGLDEEVVLEKIRAIVNKAYNGGTDVEYEDGNEFENNSDAGSSNEDEFDYNSDEVDFAPDLNNEPLDSYGQEDNQDDLLADEDANQDSYDLLDDNRGDLLADGDDSQDDLLVDEGNSQDDLLAGEADTQESYDLLTDDQEDVQESYDSDVEQDEYELDMGQDSYGLDSVKDSLQGDSEVQDIFSDKPFEEKPQVSFKAKGPENIKEKHESKPKELLTPMTAEVSYYDEPEPVGILEGNSEAGVRALLEGITFKGGTLQYANLVNCALDGVSLEDCIIDGGKIENCELKNCFVDNVTAFKAVMEKSTVKFSILSDSEVIASEINGLEVTGGKFIESEGLELKAAGTVIEKGNYKQINLKNAVLIGVHCEDGTITDTVSEGPVTLISIEVLASEKKEAVKVEEFVENSAEGEKIFEAPVKKEELVESSSEIVDKEKNIQDSDLEVTQESTSEVSQESGVDQEVPLKPKRKRRSSTKSKETVEAEKESVEVDPVKEKLPVEQVLDVDTTVTKTDSPKVESNSAKPAKGGEVKKPARTSWPKAKSTKK